jgi:outer membrane protein TolC
MNKSMNYFRNTLQVSGAAALLLLAGCRVGPKYQVPPATAQAPPATYKESTTNFPIADGWKVAQPQDAMLRGKWWEIYNDPELNTLEDQLNINNQNIKQFFENFMEARTLIAQARSQLFPTLGTTPAYTRSKSSANLSNTSGTGNATTSGTGTVTSAGRQSTLESLPFEASWEPDLWGKVRNTISEFQYSAQVSAVDLENERLTEQASLAVFFFELRGQDALYDLFKQTVDADQKALDLTKAQYDSGWAIRYRWSKRRIRCRMRRRTLPMSASIERCMSMRSRR